MVSLHFQNISKFFDKTIAVNDLTLDVREGELFFLLGPSGCGKTTCLRMVAGFLKPERGQLLFDERDISRVPPHKRNTGMVFQNYALWPHMTVRGNVEYGLRVRKMSREERNRRANEALAMVRLEHLADRYPNQLSGGQQQRVALARALVIRPDVLLLDEPLSNLDAQLRLEMRREIKRLHRETGTTALYVTHDQNEALSIADRMGVMKDGVLMQVGTPREIYRRPRSRFVAEFIGESNFLPGTLKGSEGEYSIVETPVGTLCAARVENMQTGQEIWCSIRPEAWQIGEASARETSTHNVLPAQLQSAMYGGETEQLVARLDGSNAEESWRDVKISVLNPATEPPHPGQKIQLSCAPDDVVILSE